MDDNTGPDLSSESEVEIASTLFDNLYTATNQSPTLRQIWRTIYGDDYPEGTDPFSFVTLTDLQHFASSLHVQAGQTFADFACGSGGPGLWVAQRTGASLIGLDFSRVAIEQAQQRARQWNLGDRATFAVRDMTATGLPAESLDGAMSVDALWLVPDKLAAVQEWARIIKQSGRLVFTTWEMASTPSGWPAQINDYRALLQNAGFAIETYEETSDWERRQRAVYASILEQQEVLKQELGEAAGALIAEAQDFPPHLARSTRVFVVAIRS